MSKYSASLNAYAPNYLLMEILLSMGLLNEVCRLIYAACIIAKCDRNEVMRLGRFGTCKSADQLEIDQ